MAGLSFTARFKERTFLVPRSGELDTSLSKPVEFVRASRSALRASVLLPSSMRLSHMKLAHISAGHTRKRVQTRGPEFTSASKGLGDYNEDSSRSRSLQKSLRTLLAERMSTREGGSNRGDSDVISKSAKTIKVRIAHLRPLRGDPLLGRQWPGRKLSP